MVPLARPRRVPARPGGSRRGGAAAGLRGSRSEGGETRAGGASAPRAGRLLRELLRAAALCGASGAGQEPGGVGAGRPCCEGGLGPEARGGGCSGSLKALGGEEGGLPRWSCQASPVALVCSHL